MRQRQDLTKLTDKQILILIAEDKKLLPEMMGELYTSILETDIKRLEDELTRRQEERGSV